MSTVESAIDAFVEAIAEARTLFNTGQLGQPLRDILRHAGELLDLIDEEISSGPRRPSDGLYRRVLARMRQQLGAVESSVPPALH